MNDRNDELMHSVGNDPAWSESYYFNFVDPTTKLAMFTRMGFRPGSGWADGLHAVYLPGKRLAFTYGRRDIQTDLSAYDGDLQAGDLSIECVEPHKQWRVRYDGPAQDIADGEILLARRKERPEGWYAPSQLTMDLTFDCLTEPHYAASGERGHFEQSGRVHGSIRLGDETWSVDGYGVRDKSWGPRDWGAGQREEMPATTTAADRSTGPEPFVNWFSMNFGADIALGGSCFRHRDGVMRGEGWMQRDGRSFALEDVVIETTYKPGSIVHKDVRLTGRTSDGEAFAIDGSVWSVCPTKIPMPGGATFVNEGLAEFRWDDRIGYGIAEHWHAVTL
ncbi:MAG: hypothetical protein NXH85_03380 [Pseudomonadaceae bacterium]|nr:hypothetical protein [Pseudomonadaceae bacterium]